MSLLVVLLLLAALVFGGIWLFVEAAVWILIIALVLLAAGAVSGFVGRGRAHA
jgi:multisubunit Na+/H+ antiporter MnhC subunit